MHSSWQPLNTSTMNVLLISLVFSAVVFTEVAGWGCERGWLPFCSHCYLFSTDTKSWFEASYICAAKGGALVSYNSPAELKWVKGQAKRLCGGRSYWISGNDIRNEGKWVWNPNTGAINRDCVDWASGEPNNAGGNQHCMQLWASKDYRWDDDRCQVEKNYICEKYLFSDRVCSCRV